jgi:hypothetical protein
VTLFDASHPGNRAGMERYRIGFGLANAGHTLDAYRRLPHGWRPAPPEIFTDLYMWRQFMDTEGCRIRSVFRPTVLHFGVPHRRGWSAERRADELASWLVEIRASDAELRILHLALDAAGARYGASTALRCELQEWYAGLRRAPFSHFLPAKRMFRTLRSTLRRYPQA